MADIKSVPWHGFSALALENEQMRVVIVPDLGAKIVSLYDKAHQHEWLVPPMRPLKQTTYGADFVSQDMSGWDEMMPTIVACSIEGANLPDHGEVWSIPWQVTQADDTVTTQVHGVALSYLLTRSAELATLDCLELRYTIRNTGLAALPFLWAAHPQFAADADTRLELPQEVIQMINVIDGDPAWGQAGEQHPCPVAVDQNGRPWRLDRVRSTEYHTCRKFYIPPEQAIGWAALVHEGKGCQLRMDWSPVELPYLGLWVDEGSYNSQPVAAFEPSNAYYDSLERAITNGKMTWLAPGAAQSWAVRICV